MMNLIKSLPLLAALAACDPVDEAVEPRGLVEVLYLTQNESEIMISDFAELVLACDGLEKAKLSVTWSIYEYPPAGADVRVMGLGFSTYAGQALADCYEKYMLALGAHP
ncbi:MAG: hypothetical protein JNL82_29805 [Myxococcales bacterium]|nr:hypothetical protein [Myxococcales bacterium]